MILPGSKVGWINLALVILLVAVGGTYHTELYWAWEQIDDYRQGYIDSPLERELYLEGRQLLYQERQPDAAIVLLEESIRIDPNSEAVFLLAESFRARGELPRAALEYERFLELDYLHIKARLALIETYRRLDKPDLARRTAQAGVAVFSDMVRRYKPKLDGLVEKRYNSKAQSVYRRYEYATNRFEKLTQ